MPRNPLKYRHPEKEYGKYPGNAVKRLQNE